MVYQVQTKVFARLGNNQIHANQFQVLSKSFHDGIFVDKNEKSDPVVLGQRSAGFVVILIFLISRLKNNYDRENFGPVELAGGKICAKTSFTPVKGIIRILGVYSHCN